MEKASSYELARQLEKYITGVLSGLDTYTLDARPRGLAKLVKIQAADARLDLRDFTYADTKAEQIKYEGTVRNRLEQLRRSIIEVSEYGIFNAVDVVHISTQIDSLLEGLE
jgi:hypothetical protein